ncbi:MAG: TlyA family RNA methyltransferase [Chloroflexi bacterium]|nr:TlyA family RNA methyltransferase [Chloroflexota bacterium]
MKPVKRKRERLDTLLVERGLAETREKARALVLAGEVTVDGRVVTRPAALVATDADVAVKAPLPYVSRGGFKLAHALDQFGLDVDGQVVVDVGASTGGFTDVLLQRGAARVYAVDVGYGQLDWRLRQNPRVVVLERTNVRYLESLPELVYGAVIDVSFISLALVLPVALRLLRPDGWIIALIKPQFEAGREEVGKGGVVRDPRVHRAVVERVLGLARDLGLSIHGCVESPIRGPAGNREFLAYLRREGAGLPLDAAVASCLGHHQLPTS